MFDRVDFIEAKKAMVYDEYSFDEKFIASLSGWEEREYITFLARTFFKAEGTLVVTCEDVCILSTTEEYRKYARKGSKYSFAYRVERDFFDALNNLYRYDEWAKSFPWDEEGDNKCLREKLAIFNKQFPKLDFENNHYYVFEF